LAERTTSLISVETSKEWFERVSRELRRRGVTNVDYRYIAPDAGAAAYVAVGVDRLPPDSLDYALVDGLHRGACALAVVDLIKPGGLLIIDNAERYFPYPSRSPERLRGQPCNSWREFLARVAGWRLIWTTSGVNDTALWIKTS
jgi:predicted O-methyltransferase YrrM